MQIFQGVEALPSTMGASVVSIGNFDGVHRGHQALLQKAIDEAHALGIPSVVFTFYPHPVTVLYPERHVQRLFDQRDQHEQLAKLGIDLVVEQEFTLNFAKLSAEDFVQFYLIEKLHAQVLVVGYDFSLGVNREGTIAVLKEICARKHIRLEVVAAQNLSGLVVSSTRIREDLRQGHLEGVHELLGRSFYLRGLVHHGDARGRTIGVPTANMTPTVDFVPRKGVYVTRTFWKGHIYPSITNIGFNPTFQEGKKPSIKAETHLLDFDDDLYGQEIQVEFLKYLRDEKKFSGIDELVKQIRADISQAREYFDGAN